MNFVSFLQAAQDRNRVFNGGLANINLLKASLERRVLFNVFLVLVERGRADATQFATRQRRLQHVRRIDRAFSSTGADQRMQLVNEKNDLALRVFNFLQN